MTLSRRGFLRGALGLAAAAVVAPEVVAEEVSRFTIQLDKTMLTSLGQGLTGDDFQQWIMRGDYHLNYPQRFELSTIPYKGMDHNQVTIEVGQSYAPFIQDRYAGDWSQFRAGDVVEITETYPGSNLINPAKTEHGIIVEYGDGFKSLENKQIEHSPLANVRVISRAVPYNLPFVPSDYQIAVRDAKRELEERMIHGIE